MTAVYVVRMVANCLKSQGFEPDLPALPSMRKLADGRVLHHLLAHAPKDGTFKFICPHANVAGLLDVLRLEHQQRAAPSAPAPAQQPPQHRAADVAPDAWRAPLQMTAQSQQAAAAQSAGKPAAPSALGTARAPARPQATMPKPQRLKAKKTTTARPLGKNSFAALLDDDDE